MDCFIPYGRNHAPQLTNRTIRKRHGGTDDLDESKDGGHRESDVGRRQLSKHFAARRFANRDYSGMPDLSFCGDRVKMTQHVLCDSDAPDIIVLAKVVLQITRHRKNSGSGVTKNPQQGVVFKFRH